MWRQPYLETCCRAALHRVTLSGDLGRPPGLKDGPCLERLAQLGLARHRPDGRFAMTEAGIARHASEILKLERPIERKAGKAGGRPDPPRDGGPLDPVG